MKVYLSPSAQPNNAYAGIGTTEQIQCNRIADYARIALIKNGYEVLKAPEGQSYVDNVNQSNAWGADVHVPIHTNAGGSSKGAMGLSHSSTIKNKYMQSVYQAVANAVPWQGIGIHVRDGQLHEIDATNCVCVYLECAFHDKSDSAQWIIDNVVALGNAIAKGFCDADGKAFDGSVPPTKPQPTPESTPKPTNDLGQVDVIYQVHTDRWWPPVTNKTDWAGAGDGIPIRYLALRVTKGSVRYRVHTDNGWLGWITECNINDLNNGCAGDGTPIDAVEVYYVTPDGYAYKRAVYRVSDLSSNEFYAEQHDSEVGNGQDGYAGVFGVWIDKLQIWIE